MVGNEVKFEPMFKTEQSVESDSDNELNGGRSVVQEVDYSDPKKASQEIRYENFQ